MVVRRTHLAATFAAVTVATALRVVPSDTVLAADLAFRWPSTPVPQEHRREVRRIGPGVAGIGAVVGAVRLTSASSINPQVSELAFVRA